MTNPAQQLSSAAEDDEDLRAWVALSVCSEGEPQPWLDLATSLGGALAVVAANDEALLERGASAAAIALLRVAWSRRSARLVDMARRLGLGIASFASEAYPPPLRQIPDPPLVLYWRGAEPASCSPAVAVVGSRRCSDYGARTAERVGRELAAAGVVVVSGLARGVDAAAHRGALVSGRTSAVLAGGLDHIYPGEHRGLADRLVEAGGCLLSEQPPGERPRAWLFPYRNRILTGLSLATVVVEADVRSGSLASARHALDQGREVFAVPGPIDSPSSVGTNRLLSQGASPFCETTDLKAVPGLSKLLDKKAVKILETNGIDVAAIDEGQASLLLAVAGGATRPDEMAGATALDGARVLALLTALELDGLVRREAHGAFVVSDSGRQIATELKRRRGRKGH